jgi:hypothetical protein
MARVQAKARASAAAWGETGRQTKNFEVMEMVCYLHEKPKPVPEGTTLKQAFNGYSSLPIAILQAKLGPEAVREAFSKRRLINCDKGRVRLADGVAK